MDDFSTEPDGDRAAPLAEGTMFGRLYRVVRHIGRGAQGDVYEVEHVRLKTRFAAKVLLTSRAESTQAVARFEREAMAASRLEHPSIVRVLNFDETDDGVPFAVMELVDGEPLDHVLLRGPLPPRTALKLVAEVASALDVAHRAGVIHRDIKPQNLLVIEGGKRIKVTDFGISKILDDEASPSKLTKTGSALGTPMYMAPEQVKNEAIDHRADIFALGLVLLEMLTGRPPSEARTTYQLLLERATKATPDPERTIPGIPPPVAALLRKATATDPNARYGSMREMLEAIAIARAGTPAMPSPPAARPWWPYAIGGASAIAFVLGVLALAQPFGGTRVPLKEEPLKTMSATTATVAAPKEELPAQKKPLKKRDDPRQPMKVKIR